MRYAVTTIFALVTMAAMAQTQGEPLYRYDEALAKKICEQVALKNANEGYIDKTSKNAYQGAMQRVVEAYFKDKGNQFREPLPMMNEAIKLAKVDTIGLQKRVAESKAAIIIANGKLTQFESRGNTFTEPDTLTQLRTDFQQYSNKLKQAQENVEIKRAEREKIQNQTDSLDREIAELKTQIEKAQKRYDDAQTELKSYGYDGVIELPEKVRLAKAEQAKIITTANAGVVAEALEAYRKYGQTYLQLHPDDKQMSKDIEALKKFHELVEPIDQAKRLMAAVEFDSAKDEQVMKLLNQNKYDRMQAQQVKPLIDALGDHEIYYFNMRRILKKLYTAVDEKTNGKKELLEIINKSVDYANPGNEYYNGYYEGYNKVLETLRGMINNGKLSKKEIERIANELKITVQ